MEARAGMRRIYPILAAAALIAAALIALHPWSPRQQAGETRTAHTGAPSVEPPPLPQGLLEGAQGGLQVWSPAFAAGGAIPRRYTCDGEDISPPLEWSTPPAGAGSLLLLVYDPDAPKGVFIHWVLYNIDPRRHGVPEGVPPEPLTPYGAQAVNDFGRVGYGGPCPPRGERHRYVFLVLVLDEKLDVPAGADARSVLAAARGHVAAYGYTWGVYGRQTQ